MNKTWLFFWTQLVILFIAFNKLLTYWNWHYVCDNGGT